MILLDTHALLWFVAEDDNMPASTRKLINEYGSFSVSAISAWEIAMLVKKERLILSKPVNTWLDTATQTFNISWIDISVDIGLLSTELPGNFHSDPADRFIVATCLSLKATLITKDRKISSYPYIKTFWE